MLFASFRCQNSQTLKENENVELIKATISRFQDHSHWYLPFDTMPSSRAKVEKKKKADVFPCDYQNKDKELFAAGVKKCRRPFLRWLIECFHIKTNTIGILLCVEFDVFCVRAINFPRFSFRQNLIRNRRQGKKDLLSRGLLCNDWLINFEPFFFLLFSFPRKKNLIVLCLS